MKKVTLKDVAHTAGVSIATVSYVLNDNKSQKISEETRERVLSAVHELGFVPNNAAKALKSQKVNCIGVVIMQNLGRNLVYRKFSRMLVTFQEELSRRGYQMLVCSGEKNSMGYPDYIGYYLEQRICGVIYVADAGQKIPEETLDYIRMHNVPFVVADGVERYENACNLIVDYYTATYNFMTYVCEKMRINNVAFLCAGDDFMYAKEYAQKKAVLDVCSKMNIPVKMFGIDGIGVCDKMEPLGQAERTDFSKWRNVLYQVDRALEQLEPGDIFLSSTAFIAECAYFNVKLAGTQVLFAVLEEFQTTPVAWIDTVSGNSNVVVNNIRADRIAIQAVNLIEDYLTDGILKDKVVEGRTVDFTKGRFDKN